MNRALKKCITLATALSLTLGVGLLAGCKDKAVTAYEIAKQHGFTGTELEWLESLKGVKGEDGKDLDINEMYERAKAEKGEDYGYMQFLQDLGVQFDLQEDNDTKMLAKNTSSVVSICCGWQMETKRLVYTGVWGAPQYVDATAVAGAEGSGVIWEYWENDEYAGAYIVTNYHVIYNAVFAEVNSGIGTDIYVYPYGALDGFTTGDSNQDGYLDDKAVLGDSLGNGIKATYVGGALDYDIAILKVENSAYLKNAQVTEVELGSSETCILGEKAYVIGNSNGKGISVTSGLLSVLSEDIRLSAFDNSNRTLTFRVMRTDAAINGGNSGGALFNAKGKLVGITNAKTTSGEIDNMGYALPIDRVKLVVENILNNSTVEQKGYLKLAKLGIVTTLYSSTPYWTAEGNIRVREEFRVKEVAEDSLAGASTDENKSLKQYDMLLSGTLNGETVTFEQRYQFQEQLLKVRKGDTITYQVKDRDGQERTVTFTFDSDDYFTIYA